MNWIRAFPLICLTMTLLFGSSVHAEPKTEQDVGLSLWNSTSEITVAADGTSKSTDTVTFLVTSELGKRIAAMMPVAYSPGSSKVKILAAETITKRVSYPVDLKKIEDREINAGTESVLPMRAQLLQFTNLDLFSNIQYTYEEIASKPAAPGVFSIRMIYGKDFSEMHGDVLIKSVKPLLYKTEMAANYLDIKEGREGALYTLRVKLRLSYFNAVKNEANPFYKKAAWPRVDVTTAQSWNQLAAGLASKYNSEIDKKLPPEFAEMARKAKYLPSWDEKIDSLLNSLNTKMTDAGKWTTSKGPFDPRSLQDIAHLKTGDSKDFATAFAALCRAIGLHADVALLNAGEATGSPLRSPVADDKGSVPMLDYFNRAIVRVEIPGTGVRWIEPALNISYPGGVAPNIAGRLALTLASATKDLERIPEDQLPDDTKITTTIDVGPDRSADESIEFVTQGLGAVLFKLASKYGGQAQLEEAIIKQFLAGRKELKRPTTILDLKQTASIHGSVQITTAAEINNDNTTMKLPFNSRWAALNFADPKRVTDLYLGKIGKTTNEIHIRGVEGSDDATSDCYALSPWYDIKRTVDSVPDGIVVHEEILQKRMIITKAEMRSEEFERFARSLGNCLKSANVALKGSREAAVIHNDPVIGPVISKGKVEDAIALLEQSNSGIYARAMIAKRILERAIQVDAKDFRAHAWLASAIRDLGYTSGDFYDHAYVDAALHEANLAVDLNPNSALTRRARARIALSAGDHNLAVRDFTVAYQLEPNDLKTLDLGARVARDAKDNAAAENWLLTSLRNSKTPPEIQKSQWRLADFYLDTKQYEKSVTTYQEVLKTDPKNAWVWHDCALALAGIPSRIDEAITNERKALSISEFGAAQFGLAEALRRKALLQLLPAAPAPTSVGAATTPPAVVAKKDPTTLPELSYDPVVISRLLTTENVKSVEPLLMEAIKLTPDNITMLETAADFFHAVGIKNSDKHMLARSADYYGRVLKLDGNHFLATENLFELHKQGIATISLDHYIRLPASFMRKGKSYGTQAPPADYPDKISTWESGRDLDKNKSKSPTQQAPTAKTVSN